METLETLKNAKKCQVFRCLVCDFKCTKQSNYEKHIATQKHKLSVSGNALDENGNKMETLETRKNARRTYKCGCGKTYTTRAGLWKHKNAQKNAENAGKMPNPKCLDFDVSEEEETPTPVVIADPVVEEESKKPLTKDEQIDRLIDANMKLTDSLANIASTMTTQLSQMSAGNMSNSHNNINQTNSHNKTFNLQFFLNETCKDAMNITDFVNSLKLSLQDLEQVGELGYAEGISQMFIKGLSELEVTRRPIHCSDLKREIIHIKDKDRWEKDNSNQDKLKKVIKDVSNKNVMLLDDWKNENPGCTEYDNRKNDIYLKMMVESMGPADAVAERKDFGKIIRSIAKNTIIDKNIAN